MPPDSPDTHDASSPAIPLGGPAPVRAVVDAGSISTTYVRAGSGDPVVILRANTQTASAGASLLLDLSRDFRVIEPELIAPIVEATTGGDSVAFSCWLREFLDGLGIARAGLVAEESVAARVLSFALADPGRVSGVVLVFNDVEDPRLPSVARPDHLGQSGHSLLVLQVPSDAHELPGAAVENVVAFLARAAGDAP